MRIHRFVSSVSALVISGAFMIGGSAIPVSAHQLNRPSQALKVRVEYRLAKKNILTNRNVSVAVRKNEIVLTGTVPTLYEEMEAGKLTRKEARGYTVINDLKLSAPVVKDSLIDAEVMRRIETKTSYTVFDWAEAHSKNGTVTLAGWVNNPLYVGWYARQAERVPGVRKVVNRLKYVFRYRRLARKAVNLIYRRGDLFPGAFLSLNPPVHIIAVDGRIILEGKTGTASFADFLANRVRYHTNAIRVYNEIRSPA